MRERGERERGWILLPLRRCLISTPSRFKLRVANLRLRSRPPDACHLRHKAVPQLAAFGQLPAPKQLRSAAKARHSASPSHAVRSPTFLAARARIASFVRVLGCNVARRSLRRAAWAVHETEKNTLNSSWLLQRKDKYDTK